MGSVLHPDPIELHDTREAIHHPCEFNRLNEPKLVCRCWKKFSSDIPFPKVDGDDRTRNGVKRKAVDEHDNVKLAPCFHEDRSIARRFPYRDAGKVELFQPARNNESHGIIAPNVVPDADDQYALGAHHLSPSTPCVVFMD